MTTYRHVEGTRGDLTPESGSMLERRLQRDPEWEQAGGSRQKKDEEGGGSDDGLGNLKRDELDAVATEAGVEEPEELPNIAAVVEAIRAKRSGE